MAGNTKKEVNSINEDEVAKFNDMADQWRDISSDRPFEGLKFADVGCGGGILSEPLARLGATVTGIDAGDKNIEIAHHHAKLDPITSSIEYVCATAEKLVEEKRQFDAVLSLEVIEHVEDPEEFAQSLSALTVPGGAMVISTPNRTMSSYAFVIIAAEYILQWIPVGTHDWTKFIKPEELTLILQRSSISVQEMAGLTHNPVTDKFLITDDISLDYIVFATKGNEAKNTAAV